MIIYPSSPTGKIHVAYLFILLLLSVTGCGQQQKNEPLEAISAYNLDRPERFPVINALGEISGIALKSSGSEAILAVQDEDGKVFEVTLGENEPKVFQFAKKGDYEDITVLDGQVYVLRSDGTLFHFPLTSLHQPQIENIETIENILPKGEYEGMYGDSISRKLYVLCKKCEQEPKNTITVFEITEEHSKFTARPIHIDLSGFSGKKGPIDKRFQPSALARNPNTNHWYVLSSINLLLVELDTEWKVQQTYALQRSLFQQPEGILFDMKGNLYISNEAGKNKQGNILFFKNRATN